MGKVRHRVHPRVLRARPSASLQLFEVSLCALICLLLAACFTRQFLVDSLPTAALPARPMLATGPWGQASSTQSLLVAHTSIVPSTWCCRSGGVWVWGCRAPLGSVGLLGVSPLVLVRVSLGMEAHCLLGPVPCLAHRQRDRAQAAVGWLGAELGMDPTPTQPLSSGRGGAAALPCPGYAGQKSAPQAGGSQCSSCPKSSQELAVVPLTCWCSKAPVALPR